ncbi:AMP-binding protein [Mesoterricola silvestris]|uniref:Aconitate hydratase n=1 Tax=Mesoterricola silvestris TaxID=2927979 RepID=A0AA48GI67_9BACT|nr:AMP-binding protein [Mesoterricola silvestris]BDU71454.1 aconitate hydratase [Mesoterricola silvestris]
MARLDGIFAQDRPEAQVVALTGKGPRTFGDLARGAAAVAGRARAGGRWLLACEDPFAFAAGFLGLVLAGCAPVLPPNLLPGTLGALEADGLLRDADLADPSDNLPPSRPLGDGPVEFWTSGSTGSPKRVLRRFQDLVREVEVLEGLFGPLPAPVASTVPHLHIYGCLFRVFWPLATGQIFLSETCGDPARFLAAMGERPVLVSSPAHLARLPRLLPIAGLDLPAVFSSGGALEREDALAWRAAAPGGVVEVYGSTESGGIAWRNPGPDADSSRWTPFPDMSLAAAADGALLLSSPRVGPAGLRMEDAVALGADGRFALLGRLDRVVKIEEKRVSLPQVEAALKAHPLVRDAAVVLLEGRRRMLGAAIVLAGPADLEDPAVRRALGERLGAHLAASLEGPALPRRWRFLPELPRDARGKLRAGDLAALFAAAGNA